MSRIRRKGFSRRDPETPLSEWLLDELKAELARLETDRGELNQWQAFKRASELQGELDARGTECRA
jgi:hypothetical protein